MTGPWVDGLTIGETLRETARRHPARDALRFPALGVGMSWSELDRRVDEAARGLLALGIRRGEHVAVWSTNVPEWILLQFASARVGAVLVTVNPAYRSSELEYALVQSDAVALFLVDRFKTSDYHAIIAGVLPELARAGDDDGVDGGVRSGRFPRLRQVVSFTERRLAGARTWREMLERGRTLPPEAVRDAASGLAPGDAINIQYTSGTTGFPKAAMLTHRNLLLNAFHVGECLALTEEDRIAIPVPFYHCFGCVLGTLCAAVHGAAMVIPAETFDPEATLSAIERERATVVYGVPTMFIAQLQHPSFPRRDLRSLRTGIMAGSPCPIEVMKQVIERMGAREMTIAYGQTESSPVITQTRTGDSLERRVETVGLPIPGVEVKIVDPLSGADLGDGVPGELCARGHVVMLGYYKSPEATRAAIDDGGWLHTGDLAVRRADGYFKITGRIKDMVIRGGENIYPREIEEFLFTHRAIEQVSVVGVPDPKYGEELCAWVQRKPGAALEEEELRSFCRAHLAHFKVPRHIRFVDAFPQTVTGKIQKFKIREQMIAELGLAEEDTA
jgi:fatty-acyl-CoA synthase